MKLFKVIETSYENFDNTIKNYLSKTLSTFGFDYSKSNIFGVIFEGIKGVLQNMLFYIEDAFTEQNIQTATRKKSVYSLAKISGYEPYYGSLASGNIIISNKITNELDHSGTKIYLHNGATFRDSSTGLSYLAYMPVDYYVFDMTKPLLNHEIKIVQGKWVNASYTALGQALESFEVNIMSLFDKDYIEVTVDGEKYTQAACIYDMSENSKEYVINVGFYNGFTLIFGNGTNGKKLVAGQNIQVKYISHSGSLGNILPTSNVTLNLVSGCYDGYGNKIDGNKYLNIKISNYITGGTDSDTIGLVRNMVGYNSRSLVLATEDNFKLFLRRFSFIGQTNIWMEKNSLSVTLSCLTNKKDYLTSPDQYLSLLPSDMLLSEDQKQMISQTMANSNKMFSGITIKFQDPIICQYSIICYVKIPVNYNKDTISTNIKNIIANYFMDLGYNIYFIAKSDIIKKVLEQIPDIESFDIEILSKDNEDGYINGIYYDYELMFINGTYMYKNVKKIYDTNNPVGLDSYGNINISSKLKVPLLHGGFKYYYDKSSRSKNKKNNDYIITESVQIIWI